MQCVHQSLKGTCVASCSSLSFSVGLLLGPALSLTRQSGGAHSSSPSILQFCFFSFFRFSFCCKFTSTQCCLTFQACRKRFDHLLSLPTENRTCFIEAHPHVHCAHSVVHVHLDHRSISNISNVRILFIQHNNVSGSKMRGLTTLALLNLMHL